MFRVAHVLSTILLLATIAAPLSLAKVGQNGPSSTLQSGTLATVLEVIPSEISLATPGAIMLPEELREFTLVLRNLGDDTLYISDIVEWRNFANLWPFDWLTLSTIGPVAIAGGDTIAMWIRVQAPVDEHNMRGAVKFVSNAFSGDTLSVPIHCASTNEPVRSLSTGCLSLAVSGTGNMGWHGAGAVNMNFAPPSECDTGINSRGNGRVYLHDASLVIVRKSPGSLKGSWDMFGVQYEYPPLHQFKWLSGDSISGPITGPGYTSYRSGLFCTIDSLVAIENTWYAPTHPDSCNFIIQKMTLYPRIPNTSVDGLAIGEAVDWAVPSDISHKNHAGYDTTRSLAYMYGHDKMDDTIDCQSNELRFAGAALLRMYTNTCGEDPYSLFSTYNVQRDSFRYPADGCIECDMWDRMRGPGYRSDTTLTDLMSLLTFKHHYTLPANDTLTVWVALATVRTADSHSAGLDSLKLAIDKAKKFSEKLGALCYSTCCRHKRGNLNGDPIESPDLSDLSLFIAYLSTTPAPILSCPLEADINGSGGLTPEIDLSDLNCLIGYLTQNPKPSCYVECPR